MHRIVFGTGVSLEIAVVIALHTQHGLHPKYCIQVRVLTAGLLPTTPTRITEDVHIGTPEGQLRIARIIRYTHRHIEQLRVLVIRTVPVGPGLVRHLREHVVH